jgi:hypothetical protein
MILKGAVASIPRSFSLHWFMNGEPAHSQAPEVFCFALK